MTPRYEVETLGEDEDNGTMPANVAELSEQVIGRRIVSASHEQAENRWGRSESQFVITLDDGRRVLLADSDDCCAHTELQEFFLHPECVDHMILGVGTTEGYTTWHIYADFGDVMKLKVGWSCGNPFYYGYGFDIRVENVPPTIEDVTEKLAAVEAERDDLKKQHEVLKNGLAQQTELWRMLKMVHRELDLWFGPQVDQAVAKATFEAHVSRSADTGRIE